MNQVRSAPQSSSFSVQHKASTRSKIGAIRSAKRKLALILTVFVVALAILLTILLQHIYRSIEAESSRVFYYAAQSAFQRYQTSLEKILLSKDIPELMYVLEQSSSNPDESLLTNDEEKHPYELDSVPGTMAYVWLSANSAPTLHLPGLHYVKRDKWTEAEQANYDRLLTLLEEKRSEISLPCIRESALLGGSRAHPVSLDLSHEFILVVYPSPCSVVSDTYSNRHYQSAGNFGVIFQTQQLLLGLVRSSLGGDPIFQSLMLSLVSKGKVQFRFDGADGAVQDGVSSYSGLLVFQGKLPAPLERYSLLFAIQSLPETSGFGAVTQVAIALALVVLWGVVVIFQLASGHLELAQQRSDFVSAVSHELRTPLTTIRMHSEMLEQGWISGEQKKSHYYSMIRQESERLSRLIENVLQLAVFTKSPRPPVLETIPGSQLIEFLSNSVEENAAHRGFEIEAKSEPENLAEEIEVTLDLDGLRQIILNLVDNAIKFAKEAEVKKIEITLCVLELARGQETLAICVRDYGPGVEEAQADHIFELFYRGEDELTRTTPGTGLGLGLAQAIADRMGARLELVRHEVGAEFRILFVPSEGELR